MARSPRLANSEANARLPEWIQPQLTRLVTEAPSGDEWGHELKFDGYRMHARLDRGDIRLLTRTGLDSHGVLKSRGLDRPFFVFQIRSLSPL
jgi:ATP-dependent DNA ligase